MQVPEVGMGGRKARGAADVVLATAVAALVAGACGSSPRQAEGPVTSGPVTTAAVPTTAGGPPFSGGLGPLPLPGTATIPDRSCDLPTTPELIERDITPNGPPIAVLVGSANVIQCLPTVEVFGQSVPPLSGYCSQLAPFDDNPGYDLNAVPAPPLRHVIAQAGRAC